MIPISLETISKITNGILYGNSKKYFNKIVIHTKDIIPNCLYIALIGKKFDAHNFISEAIKRGSGAVLVEKKTEFDIPQVVVPNTLTALGNIASWTRKQVKTHIVGLTGSAGKTTVKEMTASILRECGTTLSTYDNFNNNIGVPMTLLRLTHTYKYAVIELGANNPGEIAYIAHLTSPHIALINNIYHSHLQGFKSLTGVAYAKQEILNHLLPFGTFIMNKDSNHWLKWKKNIRSDQKVLQFSIKKK
jgi:UDP-N-acetylmuramoyl-tripeptide--D-alanyl-D-alanine ligase